MVEKNIYSLSYMERTEKNYYPFIAQGKMLRLFKVMVVLLRKGGASLKEIAGLLQVTERSARRYINALDYMNIGLDQDFQGRYFIPSEYCPLCHQQPTTNENRRTSADRLRKRKYVKRNTSSAEPRQCCAY